MCVRASERAEGRDEVEEDEGDECQEVADKGRWWWEGTGEELREDFHKSKRTEEEEEEEKEVGEWRVKGGGAKMIS